MYMYRANKGLRGRGLVFTITMLVVALILLAGGGALGYHAWQNSKRVVSKSIRTAASFTLFWPSPTAPIRGDRTTIKYDYTENLFSFVAHTDDGTTITISEQATPGSFVDIPQSYDKLTEGLHSYKAFDSQAGKVNLTRPSQLNGAQSAVLNSKGTLLFMRPSKDLSDDTWQKIFNNLHTL